MIANVRILIAHADEAAANQLALTLVRLGYFCEFAATEREALAVLARHTCELVLWDRRGDGDSSLALLDALKTVHPLVPVIVLSALGDTAEAVLAIKHGAYQYIVEPCAPELIQRHVQHALASVPAVAATRAAWDDDLVHASEAMREVLSAAEQVAMSAAPLLILGESGCGKERIARAIHARGPRRDRPFVAINAAAVPENLLESELFGHVRGAFTGAQNARLGLFGEAHGGTLLLDEIGDMPAAIQPKLLRTLQFGECRAVGSDRVRTVDVRIIAATHRDLHAMGQSGHFRDDLRYRLETLTIMIPPLRERRADIAPLALRFLAAARTRAPSSPVREIGAAAMAVLEQAAWHGNVRELESAIERLVVMGREAVAQPADLTFLRASQRALPAVTSLLPTADEAVSLKELSDRYIAWVLARADGDKARAADTLGIDVSTLYRWQRARRGL